MFFKHSVQCSVFADCYEAICRPLSTYIRQDICAKSHFRHDAVLTITLELLWVDSIRRRIRVYDILASLQRSLTSSSKQPSVRRPLAIYQSSLNLFFYVGVGALYIALLTYFCLLTHFSSLDFVDLMEQFLTFYRSHCLFPFMSLITLFLPFSFFIHALLYPPSFKHLLIVFPLALGFETV